MTKPDTTLTDGSPVTEDHADLKDNGQQKGYVVLSEAERAKGFIEPDRDTYVHNMCGKPTVMASSIAETYAREPTFYGGTFCTFCKTHFDNEQFKWLDGTTLGKRSNVEQ